MRTFLRFQINVCDHTTSTVISDVYCTQSPFAIGIYFFVCLYLSIKLKNISSGESCTLLPGGNEDFIWLPDYCKKRAKYNTVSII